MSQFNLIDEAWIPVRRLDGTRVELGIGEVLRQAKDLAVIEDPSPLVTASLHRFLLAVLYRALEGPADIDQAKVLFKAGLPVDRIDAYLERWRDRFWLFDETHPFGQNPNVPANELEPWTKLTAEHNATSNKVLFDHTDAKMPGARSYAECARWLISTMSFSVSGGRGYSPSPSSNGIMCIPVGINFHDTLCFCLVDQKRDVIKGDTPLWEHDPATLPITASKRAPRGSADLYTWPARMILLEKALAYGVTHIRFVAGFGCDPDASFTDPMLAYTYNKEKGKYAVPFREGRGTWRDFDSLLPDNATLAPAVIEHAAALTRYDHARFPRSVVVLGQSSDKAKIEFWRLERFALPEALLGERSIRTEIHQLLADAEASHGALKGSCDSFARSLLAHGDRKVQKSDIDQFVKQMPVSAVYWSTLEAAFHDVLRHYTADSDPDAIRLDWLKTVRKTLRAAWQQHAASVSTGDAWAIRALVRAEAHINKQVGALNKEIQQYETHHSTQNPSQEEPA